MPISEVATSTANDPSDYFLRGDTVYERDGDSDLFDIPIDVDPTTFVVSTISPADGKDKHSVFCNEESLPNADLATFTVLSGHSDESMGWDWSYSKDKYQVFYNCDLIPDADPQTFEIVAHLSSGFVDYAKDKGHVYAESCDGDCGNSSNVGRPVVDNLVELSGADPTTFQLVNRFQGIPDHPDPASLPVAFGEDKSHVYELDHLIAGASPLTFTLLCPDISDSSGLYECNAPPNR